MTTSPALVALPAFGVAIPDPPTGADFDAMLTALRDIERYQRTGVRVAAIQFHAGAMSFWVDVRGSADAPWPAAEIMPPTLPGAWYRDGAGEWCETPDATASAVEAVAA